MPTDHPKNRFITGFTGLRALAVICVILYHFNPALFSGGYLGVPVFLTLSGYLVTDHLLNEYQTTGTFSYGHFWYKRLKRLYPTLIVMLFATAAYITFFQRNILANLWQSIVTNLAYVYNWFEILNGQSYFQKFAGSESPFTHLWTLSIEGQFYLIWPLIVILLLRFFRKSKRGIFWTALILSVISALLMAFLFKPGVDPSRVYYGTDTRMFSILLGACLAVLWPSQKTLSSPNSQQRWFFEVIGAIGMAGMVITVFTVGAQSPFLYRGGMFLFSIFTVLAMWAIVANASVWNRLLTNPVFDWIGSRSYEIYVYQLPVFVFFGDKIKNLADYQWLYALIEVAIILVISELSYRYVEVPFSHYDYAHAARQILNFVSHITPRRAILSLIIALGMVGFIQSTIVDPKVANHSPLANHIKQNAKKEKQYNQKLAQQIKDGKKVKRTSADEAKIQKDGLTKAQLKQAQQLSGSAVGDSVMLAGRDDLQKIFPQLYIDAQVSRQADVAVSSLKTMQSKGVLGKNVIIGLGTNGNINQDTIDEVIKIAGPNRNVFWINNHIPSQPWQNKNNELLTEAHQKNKNFYVIDWNDYVENHPDWLYNDQAHPNTTGAPKYATFIAKNVLEHEKK
ncbi:acyltransferase family protein [Fructilactobacillus carniphilus]|uniref:Acetyltransferase n=1 Tax=Fructilactobacillus carniphilus TaxID=2940297 RepID=A0ABY5BX16_9LACO|nr:acyltransferase family protein [Fructilactobacillus carniphilus]USS90344.1 acetyltransferase [Fructilactobacillus carniphilus]